MNNITKYIVFVLLLALCLPLAGARKEQKTVLFCKFEPLASEDGKYLQILQPLLSRQTKRYKLYTIKEASASIRQDAVPEEIKSGLKSLTKKEKADFAVYGFVSSDLSQGTVTISGFVYDLKKDTLIEIAPETTETGARFINGCDSFSNKIGNIILQQDLGVRQAQRTQLRTGAVTTSTIL